MAAGFSFPDGYFSLKIPGVVRTARYLSIAQGRPYAEVCEALDDIAEECAVGVAGFHHMSLREIADNTGLRPRNAELARAREFDEPFYFTSADEKAIARFVETARAKRFRRAARRDVLAFFLEVRHRARGAHRRPAVPGRDTHQADAWWESAAATSTFPGLAPWITRSFCRSPASSGNAAGRLRSNSRAAKDNCHGRCARSDWLEQSNSRYYRIVLVLPVPVRAKHLRSHCGNSRVLLYHCAHCPRLRKSWRSLN